MELSNQAVDEAIDEVLANTEITTIVEYQLNIISSVDAHSYYRGPYTDPETAARAAQVEVDAGNVEALRIQTRIVSGWETELMAINLGGGEMLALDIRGGSVELLVNEPVQGEDDEDDEDEDEASDDDYDESDGHA